MEAHSSYDHSLPPHLASIGETRFILSLAQNESGFCKGLVVAIDLSLSTPLVEEALKAHRELIRNSGSVLSGVRATLANHEGFYSYKQSVSSIVSGVQLLGQHHLPLDVWVYFDQLNEMVRLCQQCPHTVVVCDHIATPLISRYGENGVWEKRFAENMRNLSQCPNARVKLGGLGLHCCLGSGQRITCSQEFADKALPWFQFVYDLFGSERVFFESNFPMDKVCYSYDTYWNGAKRLAKLFSKGNWEVRRRLLFSNANDLYRLNLALPSLSCYAFGDVVESRL